MSEEKFHALDRYPAKSFDRGAPLWKEALWILVSCLWFETPFPFPSSWRRFWLRRFGAQVGRGVVIRSKVRITMPWRLSIGDYSWIGEETQLLTLARIDIGSHVCISQRAFLCTGSHDFRSLTFDLITRPIRIGNEAWIAAQSFVGPGVEIGRGTVVCAGSIVVRSLPEGVIARGNPAQVTGDRQRR